MHLPPSLFFSCFLVHLLRISHRCRAPRRTTFNHTLERRTARRQITASASKTFRQSSGIASTLSVSPIIVSGRGTASPFLPAYNERAITSVSRLIGKEVSLPIYSPETSIRARTRLQPQRPSSKLAQAQARYPGQSIQASRRRYSRHIRAHPGFAPRARLEQRGPCTWSSVRSRLPDRRKTTASAQQSQLHSLRCHGHGSVGVSKAFRGEWSRISPIYRKYTTVWTLHCLLFTPTI